MTSERRKIGTSRARQASDRRWDRRVAAVEELALSCAFQALRDALLARAGPLCGRRVLDVGAGTGLLALAAARQGAEVVALDCSTAMCGALETKAEREGLSNLTVVGGRAEELPFQDRSFALVLSNYCYHHLPNPRKRQALAHAYRVLEPGGQLLFADMMFSLLVRERRDGKVALGVAARMLRRGPAGALRLARNIARLVAGRGEHPASPRWWEQALREAGFVAVEVTPLAHEGGIASGRRPAQEGPPSSVPS